LKADIKLWVLTGDKKETAIEIGKSCNLIEENDICIDLTSNPDSTDTREAFVLKFEEILSNFKFKEKKNDNKVYMIIDGSNLAYILSDTKMSKRFFKLGLNANSVICCRVSPKQKSLVVKLAKENGNWITLSIGDGANDVPMIMEAHIGVGIAGKEGSQVIKFILI
jgi:magnesium-transporting ATPase (P-type)